MLQLALPDLRMRHLASLELASDLDLVPFLEEPPRVLQQMRNIMFRDSRADLYTLYVLRFALVLLLPPVLLVFELAVIDDPANGRVRRCGNENEVEGLFLGHRKGFAGIDDSDLAAVGCDQAHLAESEHPLVDHGRGARAALAPKMWPAYLGSPHVDAWFFCIRSTVYQVGVDSPQKKGGQTLLGYRTPKLARRFHGTVGREDEGVRR